MTTNERKKLFDQIFKDSIVPFGKKHGYQRFSKTTKRLIKHFDNGLWVVIYFEFKNFGSGFYDISIAYYDEEIGTMEDDIYLCMPTISKPALKGKTAEELSLNTAVFLDNLDKKVFSFIAQNNTHKAIVNSNEFYFSPFKKTEIDALLMRKSQLPK